MMWRLLIISLIFAGAAALPAQPSYPEFDQPPHNYWQRPLQDRFTQLKAALESGQVPLAGGGEKAFLLSLLKTLQIPPTSQMLVFSTTSLQLSLISPRNPRALYFNEDVYLGYIPGGRIEIVSLDPELGGIYYISDIPRDAHPPRFERSNRCMNCHAGEDTGRVPGLVIKSVMPGPGGGSLNAYRLGQTGHQIPFEERFGGWYVSGWNAFTNHWGNLTGRLSPQGLQTFPVKPGERFNFAAYPVATSDVLPQLLLEHQAGFVNRVVAASYRARAIRHAADGKPDAAQTEELDHQAEIIARYLLFADEAPLPGVAGDTAFKADFLRNRRTNAKGASLKDFDLRTRLFQHRCSYMIYSAVFQGLPGEMKRRVYQRLGQALSVKKSEPGFARLPAEEREAIHDILRETLPDLPLNW